MCAHKNNVCNKMRVSSAALKVGVGKQIAKKL